MKTVILIVEMEERDEYGDSKLKYLTEVCEVGLFKQIKTPKKFIDQMQGLYHKANRSGGSSQFRILNVIID